MDTWLIVLVVVVVVAAVLVALTARKRARQRHAGSGIGLPPLGALAAGDAVVGPDQTAAAGPETRSSTLDATSHRS